MANNKGANVGLSKGLAELFQGGLKILWKSTKEATIVGRSKGFIEAPARAQLGIL